MRRKTLCQDRRLESSALFCFEAIHCWSLATAAQDDVQIMEGDDIEPCLLYQRQTWKNCSGSSFTYVMWCKA